MDLELKCFTEIDLIRLRCKWLLLPSQSFKQPYTSNKTEHFSYIGGLGIHVLRCLKEELAWAIDKWFSVY